MTLRAVGAEDLDLLGQWRNDPEHESVYGDFLPMARRQNPFPERWDVDGLLGEDNGTLMICVAGRPVGAVQWHPVHYGPNRGSQALNIGIAIAPAARGQGVGSRAQRLVCEWLFRHTTVNRVEASTDIENLAEQRSLEKAGFTREGLLRGAQFRGGAWHDLVQYSRLRNDPATN
ncbi:GNAT family N-acetyltransferase [Kineosporia sp. J2-2]|uniref:GNAT family N-acetyltransferase n=1 Tax=Kineosporia corallincola TaxID=2835133 RepID=A0ABS5TJN6_9ACTN|nr:GNAT family protein [Kineosporia corallincola]MBT0771053.1 GNAT family N-acetyltransferase [Kineosporia corallincola]